MERYFNINNITNGESGHFHNWTVSGKNFVCTICGVNSENIKLNSSKTEAILNNYKNILLRKNAEKYCTSGEFHNFVYDSSLKCDICKKCKFKDSSNLSNKELNEIEKYDFKYETTKK